MSCPSGYVNLPAKKVADACYRFIDAREKKIAARREKLIEETMKPGRFFNRSGRTREEAIARLQNTDYGDAWYTCQAIGWYAIGMIEDVLLMSRAVGEETDTPVMVSAEVAAVLFQEDYFR